MSIKTKNAPKVRYGDTLVEVTMAIAIFATIAAVAINTMNEGVANAERSLEVTMARNEIDAQSEALRFIQNNYIVEREFTEANHEFYQLWDTIISKYTISANEFNKEYDMNDDGIKSCDVAFEKQVRKGGAPKNGVFVINPRLIQPNSVAKTGTVYKNLMKKMIVSPSQRNSIDGQINSSSNYVMRTASLYPRMIYKVLKLEEIDDSSFTAQRRATSDDALVERSTYRDIISAEGIWVIGVKGEKTRMTSRGAIPEFYDFYIRTCWQSNTVSSPSTLTTIVRLYNPDVMEQAE